MKRLLLALLACAFLTGVAAAQDNPPTTQQQAETSSPEVLESMKLSAEVVRLHNEGKYDKALPLAKRALQLREKSLPHGHPLIVDALTNLAEVYAARRDYGTARDYYQRVLTFYEQSPPPQGRATVARVLDNAAYLSYVNLDFDKAENYFKRSLALREELTGAGSLETARAAFNLAEFYRLTREYSKAEPLYQKSIEVRGNALGAKNEEVRKALERYSCVYYARDEMGKWADVAKQFSFLRGNTPAPPDEVLNGKAISLPNPVYPKEAKYRKLAGYVVIKIKIDEKGKVISAEDRCGAHPLLVAPSVRAAYDSRFTPTLVEGKPVQVTGLISYRFYAW
ncbi:MAG TPA: tetratricopeptide repeat protein [Pyrinomonadaceae bacterium]|nr:tetratricopeptide repeat protein [Pyrinomonadaceae bacterium]